MPARPRAAPASKPLIRWRALGPDLSPLRTSRSFRLLWMGQLISVTGSHVRLVAVPYQVYVLTGSPLAVGLIGLFQAVPLITLSLFGGVVADAIDRRRLLLVTQVGLMATSLALAVATQLDLASVPLLYALTAVGACFSALDSPARASLAPSLVERRQIPSAMALNQTLFQTATIVGPAIAGVLISRGGLALAYWVDVLSFLAALIATWLLRAPVREPGPRQQILRSLVEGIRYVGARRILLGTMSLDFLATFFGSPRALLPYYADRVFHVGPDGLGLLYAAGGVGALLAGLASGWTSRVERQGRAVLAAVVVWGLAIAAFGALGEGTFWLGIALLGLAAAADLVSTIFRSSILQLAVPDRLRGRLNAINAMFVFGGPYLGQVESGVVAAAWTAEAAVISGGLACVVAVGAVALAAPEVAAYRASAHEHEEHA